jgi:DNA-binding MarR family transcriptional regulator
MKSKIIQVMKSKTTQVPKSKTKKAGSKTKRPRVQAQVSSFILPSGTSPAHNVLTQHVGYCLMKLAIRIKYTLDKTFARLDILTPHFGILSVLEHMGPSKQADICTGMGVDKATMVKLIDDLERLGFVLRTPDKKDRRVKYVSITPAGKETRTRALKEAQTIEKEFFKTLSPEQILNLKQILRKLLE